MHKNSIPESNIVQTVGSAGERSSAGAETVFAGMGIAAFFKFIIDGLKTVPGMHGMFDRSFLDATGMHLKTTRGAKMQRRTTVILQKENQAVQSNEARFHYEYKFK